MIITIDHVQLAMPRGREGDARQFYGGLLGLKEVEKPDTLKGRGGVWFVLTDGRQLHLGVEDPFAPARKASWSIIWMRWSSAFLKRAIQRSETI